MRQGLISGSGRSPGGGHNNPLQYSCQETPMGRGTWQATGLGFILQSRNSSSEKKGVKNWGKRGCLPWIQGEWPMGRSVLQNTCVLAIPQTSRNYLHLSISESDLYLLGTATDESLRLWSSPSRPDKHTYKCKRYRMQKHVMGVLQKNLYFENSKTKITQHQRSVV